MKKFWLSLGAAALAGFMAFSLVGCGEEESPSGGGGTGGGEEETGSELTADGVAALVSQQLTEEEWRAAFAAENFANFKTEYVYRMAAENGDIDLSTLEMIYSIETAKNMREEDIYMHIVEKDMAEIEKIASEEIGEYHAIWDCGDSPTFYTTIKKTKVTNEETTVKENPWSKEPLDVESGKVDPAKLAQYVWLSKSFTSNNLEGDVGLFWKTVQVSTWTEFADMYASFRYNAARGGYELITENLESEIADEALPVLKFKDGKLVALYRQKTLDQDHMDNEDLPYCIYSSMYAILTYGGQSITIPKVEETD